MTHLGEEIKKEAILEVEIKNGHGYTAFVVADLATPQDGMLARMASQDRTFGPMPWPGPRGTLYPSRGDRCLITIDDDDQYWCIAWWPYD